MTFGASLTRFRGTFNLWKKAWNAIRFHGRIDSLTKALEYDVDLLVFFFFSGNSKALDKIKATTVVLNVSLIY